MVCKKITETSTASGAHREKDGDHDVSYISHAGNLFWSTTAELEFFLVAVHVTELLLKFGGKVLGACATILLPIGVIWLGFKIVFAVVPLLFKLVCAALICYLVYRILREMKKLLA